MGLWSNTVSQHCSRRQSPQIRKKRGIALRGGFGPGPVRIMLGHCCDGAETDVAGSTRVAVNSILLANMENPGGKRQHNAYALDVLTEHHPHLVRTEERSVYSGYHPK